MRKMSRIALFVTTPFFVAGIMYGCKSRQFSGDKGTPNGSASSPSSAITSWSMPDLSKGAAAWRNDIVDDPTYGLQFPPSQNYSQDMLVTDGAATHYKTIASRKENPPRKFAAKTVLEAMRIIRSWTHTKQIYAGIKKASHDLSVDKLGSLVRSENPDYAAYEALGAGLGCQEAYTRGDWRRNCKDGWVSSHGDQEWYTLVGYAHHWSDLQAHFYAATGHRNHGCYTSVLGEASSKVLLSASIDMFEDGEKATAANLRQTAVDICAFDRPLAKTAHSFGPYVTGLKTEFAGINSTFWVDPKTRKFVDQPSAPKTYPESVKFKKDGYINMFDYVMFAQTFAFDLELQQKVINAFYGDVKLLNESKDIEPNNNLDCQYWRPERQSPSDNLTPGKTVCQAEAKESKWVSKGY